MNESAEYRQLFVAEAQENLQALSDGALKLERGADVREAVDGLFRAAHTMKGMSATMGFDGLTKVCHAMEDILDTVRSGQRDSSPQLADALLASVDFMAGMLNNVAEGGDGGAPDADLLSRFQTLNRPMTHKAAAAGTEEPVTTAQGLLPEGEGGARLAVVAALAQGRRVLRLTVGLDSACAFKGVRALLVRKALERLAPVLATWPTGKAFEDAKFDRTFVLWTADGVSAEEQEQAVLRVLEVTEVHSVALHQGLGVDPLVPGYHPPEPVAEALLQAPSGGAIYAAPEAGADPSEAGGFGQTLGLHPTVRVSVGRLDKIMDLVGELVTAKIRLAQIGRAGAVKDLGEAVIQVGHIVNELQQEVTAARMVPMDQMFSRFPRLIRDLGRSMEKPLDLILEGREIELDRSILDEIGEAVVHLLRNAADHGIEPSAARVAAGKPAVGTIRLEAQRDKNYVVILVEDDGAGIDTARIRQVAVEKGLLNAEAASMLSEEEAVAFIFSPGFSTAAAVTSVSGRGVGMDAVRTRVEALGGSLRVENIPGRGARFRMRVPLTLAIIRALRVRVGLEHYMVPVANVIEAVEYLGSDVSRSQDVWTVSLRNEPMVLYHLDELLGLKRNTDSAYFTVLVLEALDRRVGLVVDEVLGQQEIAIKNLGRNLKSVRGFGGVTLLGDGSVCLILDLPSLLHF